MTRQEIASLIEKAIEDGVLLDYLESAGYQAKEDAAEFVILENRIVEAIESIAEVYYQTQKFELSGESTR